MVDDVASVQPFWAQLPLPDRARYMRRAAQVIIDQLDELAELLSREQGKPRNEAYVMELLPTIDALHWIAEAGPGILEDERVPLPVFIKQKRARFTFEPLGVVGVIAPWNYPWSIPFGEVAIALMAGNGVVLKPASLTPLIGAAHPGGVRARRRARGARAHRARRRRGRAGAGRVDRGQDLLHGLGRGRPRAWARRARERMKGSVLELGGKDPMIVCADANLRNAISGCLWGGFANAGQTCSGIERVYVVDEVADRFVEGVVDAARRRCAWATRSTTSTEIGPMVSREQFELVRELVDDAVANGATLHCGGPVDVAAHPSGNFYAPAVLTGVTHDMRIMREEIFGPGDPDRDRRVRGRGDRAGQRLAVRAGRLGLDDRTAPRASGSRERIQSGMVWINDHMFSHGACSCSWGGVKDSGLGRSHSKFGL